MEDDEGVETEFFTGPYCEVCKLYLQSEQMLWRHMSGKKHLKAMKAMVSGRPLPQKIQDRDEAGSSVQGGDEISSIEKAFASLTADEPVIGLGFVVETPGGTETLFTCELCDSKCNQNNMVLHVIGLKHRMAYLKKCDPERYTRLKKTQKRSKLTEDTRRLCKEVESAVGRGRPRYKGPKLSERERNTRPLQVRQLSADERRLAMESLKRTLMQQFALRNLDSGTTNKMLEERLELMKEYERRGVPFDLAKERVLEEEDRWSLLLEFERQSLTFDEAEERISFRMDLLKAYEVNGCPKDEARKKVLDNEVVRDFRKDFHRLGLDWDQSQKLVDRRLKMLEQLHFRGFSQEEASQKVMHIERVLGRCLQNRSDCDMEWVKAGQDIERFIDMSFKELGLSSRKRERQVKTALRALDKYKKEKMRCSKAKRIVLVDHSFYSDDDDDGDATDPSDKEDKRDRRDRQSSSSKDPVTPSTSGSQVDFSNDADMRLVTFMSKLHAVLQIDKQSTSAVDKDKQLAVFDQLSHLELQSLLSDSVKTTSNVYEARNRFVALYQKLEGLRQNLFPFVTTSESNTTERLSAAFKLFLQTYSSGQQASPDKSPHQDSPRRSTRSRSRDRRRHSSRKGRSRSWSRSSHEEGAPHSKRMKRSSVSRSNSKRDSRSRSRHNGRRRSPSPRHRHRQRSRDREHSKSPAYSHSPDYDKSPQYDRSPQYGHSPKLGDSPKYGSSPEYGHSSGKSRRKSRSPSLLYSPLQKGRVKGSSDRSRRESRSPSSSRSSRRKVY